jgi:hypothetical protein
LTHSLAQDKQFRFHGGGGKKCFLKPIEESRWGFVEEKITFLVSGMMQTFHKTFSKIFSTAILRSVYVNNSSIVNI